MHIESLREYCLSKKGATEGFPFDSETLVFKVMSKMFALTSLKNPVSINLKCEPEYAISLREEYPDDVLAGYHMNKKHWNTVMIRGRLRDDFLQFLIDHSYEEVVKKLKKTEREQLASFGH